jgi:hypothetical protein
MGKDGIGKQTVGTRGEGGEFVRLKIRREGRGE